MKKVILILLATVFCFSFSDTKITYKADQIKAAKTGIYNVYQYVQSSNLPHQDVLKLSQMLEQVDGILSQGDSTAHK